MKKYTELSDNQKHKLLFEEYEQNNKSFQDIAKAYGTYANKIRRDALKFKINIRDKSQAQKNALTTGKASHPTEGKTRTENIKNKIGLSVMKSWEDLDESELQKRKDTARQNWETLSDDAKSQILKKANDAVRVASKTGSRLEKSLLDNLLKDGYKVDFHKEQMLANTKLQIDLFLPTLNVAIEVDGLSHFEPVWGEETLKKNKGYDNKKTGLILGKGLVLIRVKQLRDFSTSRASLLYDKLKNILSDIQTKFPDKDNRNLEIED